MKFKYISSKSSPFDIPSRGIHEIILAEPTLYWVTYVGLNLSRH